MACCSLQWESHNAEGMAVANMSPVAISGDMWKAWAGGSQPSVRPGARAELQMTRGIRREAHRPETGQSARPAVAGIPEACQTLILSLMVQSSPGLPVVQSLSPEHWNWTGKLPFGAGLEDWPETKLQLGGLVALKYISLPPQGIEGEHPGNSAVTWAPTIGQGAPA
ncbi:hypothetical protein NDU88_002151 [Pleurodeles waltl]|uniref:Uncharacterized protein n=1 Tax=Pleurodeles waltl TaxID=8319 RepID=A0AAV7VDY4_PLEWA|nr:hypothetical protein NDU88_002151 [Pleurodeles waltl]